MSIQVFSTLFNWVVGFFAIEVYKLYILEIKPLSLVSFETIFSQSIDCLFFCNGFLCCAKACQFD